MTGHKQQKWTLAALLSVLSGVSFAGIQGISFEHKDWELACDNTGTCRAAGYQSDEHYEYPVSLLLTRNAGANAQVSSEVQFGGDDEQSVAEKFELKINGKSYGFVRNSNASSTLSAAQLQAILATAQKDAKVEFIAAKQHYILSTEGMSAVLLKMDDFQKRVGTSSALFKKGQNANQNVLKPEAKPIVVAKPLNKGREISLLPTSEKALKIIPLLKKTTNADDCPVLFGEVEYFDTDRLVITPLTKDLNAVSNACWKGAYNFGWATWVMNKDLTEVKQFVSNSISDEDGSQLFANHKGRGVGDCWSQAEWTWNGQRYIQTLDSTTGQCKGFAGGAWSLSTVITEVKGLKQ